MAHKGGYLPGTGPIHDLESLETGRMITRAKKMLSGDGLRAQLLRGGIGSLVVKAGNAGLGFLVAVTLARLLGPDGYGVYSFALAVIMLTAIPAQVGVPQLVVRETAKSQVNGNYRLMRGLWRWSNLAVGIFSAAALIVVGGIVWLTNPGEEGPRVSTLAIGIALVPVIALSNVRGACLRGLRKVVLGQLPESIVRPALLLFLVLIWSTWSVEGRLTPQVAMAFYVVAAVLAFAFGVWLLQRSKPGELSESSPREYQSLAWRKAVIPLAMITGLQLINNYADLIILGIFRPDEEVGIYRAVTQISLLIIFGFQAINQVFQPYYARHIEGDTEKLQRLVTFSSRLIALSAIVPAMIALFLAGPLLSIIFGSAYEAGALALIILAVGQIVNAFMGALGLLLNMTGNERITFRWVSWSALINVVGTLLLVPPLGMEGAALSSMSALIIYNLLLWREVKVRLGVNTLPIRCS